jgi:phosphorylase/glycogen(starch) synthase
LLAIDTTSKTYFTIYIRTNTILFEVSWEVCNRVGGIYTALSTKAKEAQACFGENYICVGPDLDNDDFYEVYDFRWAAAINYLRSSGISCRYGKWNVPTRPQAILIDYQGLKAGWKNLYDLLLKYNIDLSIENWKGADCSVFGLLAGRMLYELHGFGFFGKNQVIGHFHEWMCGTGIIFLKDIQSKVLTVFTTHATSIGRYLSKMKLDLPKNIESVNADFEAQKYKILTKHLLEKTSAKLCDIFTTVSEATGKEAGYLLGRIPDHITVNGLDSDSLKHRFVDDHIRQKEKKDLILDINQNMNWNLPSDTSIILFTGRAEFRNKGLDILIDTLSRMENDLKKRNKTVLFICAILMQQNNTMCFTPPDSEIVRKDFRTEDKTNGYYQLTKAFLLDSFKKHCMNNDGAVKFIFIPSFLDGDDGIINRDYGSLLTLCDIGVYPSLYEPWGYTAHETALMGVPTITSDMSGFGQWVKKNHASNKGIHVLSRMQRDDYSLMQQLKSAILDILMADKREQKSMREDAHLAATDCCWNKVYENYIECYSDLYRVTCGEAVRKNEE